MAVLDSEWGTGPAIVRGAEPDGARDPGAVEDEGMLYYTEFTAEDGKGVQVLKWHLLYNMRSAIWFFTGGPLLVVYGCCGGGCLQESCARHGVCKQI